MDEYEYEVVWHGAMQREGTSTKGELLGSYRTINYKSIEEHHYLNRRIRAKIEAGRRQIRKDDDD